MNYNDQLWCLYHDLCELPLVDPSSNINHHHIPAQYNGHVTGVTESELVSWLAYACQGRIALNCNKNQVKCSLTSVA